MLTHTGTLWQYLGSFVMYTLLTVGAIYGVFWYSRKATGGASIGSNSTTGGTQDPLILESTLPLEPNKTLYVIRTGAERFLLSSTAEGTQLLSKLESVPAPAAEPVVAAPPAEPKVDLPWYATEPPRLVTLRRQGFGERFVKSIQWLVSSRMR
jgi:flagellar biogenesis protein FliO